MESKMLKPYKGMNIEKSYELSADKTIKKDSIVYMNLYHLFTYLLENKQDILERVLQSPPYSGLYQRYSQESPEISRIEKIIYNI